MWCCNDSFTKAYGAGKDQMLGIPGEVCHSLIIESKVLTKCITRCRTSKVFTLLGSLLAGTMDYQKPKMLVPLILCVCIEICNECEF